MARPSFYARDQKIAGHILCRFLINLTPGDTVAAPITVIQHWQAGIKK
jgi:hypothetical protein